VDKTEEQGFFVVTQQWTANRWNSRIERQDYHCLFLVVKRESDHQKGSAHPKEIYMNTICYFYFAI
jgi:hypothetical protein